MQPQSYHSLFSFLRKITVLHRGGLAKWLQYYIGVVRHMITVLHSGCVLNDYGTPWIFGCYIRNIISRDLTRKLNFYQLVKKHFWGVCQNYYNFTEGGYGEMITVLHRGGYAQMITILHRGGGGGSLGTPKSDYVICARPLTYFMFFDVWNSTKINFVKMDLTDFDQPTLPTLPPWPLPLPPQVWL